MGLPADLSSVAPDAPGYPMAALVLGLIEKLRQMRNK